MAYFTFTQRPQFSQMFSALRYVCRQLDPNNGSPVSTLITEPKQYEVIMTAYGAAWPLYTRVLDYDITKLSRTEKYGTTSYNFASVEFYAKGYFIGSNFINKEYSSLYPEKNITSLAGTNLTANTPATLALAMVTSAGFLPSPHLISEQPIDPNSPNQQLIPLEWFVYYIIPSPSVVLEIMFP